VRRLESLPLKDLTRPKPVITAVLLLFVLLALPQLMSLYYVDTMTQVAVYSMVALALGVLVGRVGLVSLGQVAVLAVGAWVAARLLFATGQPYLLIVLEAGVVTMIAGTAIGLPALRLRGLYLALITLMLAGGITYASRADNDNSAEGWQCWATGSPCTGISYPVAGMQQMINAVRGAGANNVIMLGGEEYSNDLTGWLQNEPTDPDHNLVASWHSYNFNSCSSQSCWTSQVAPVIAQVPVVAGEIGENDCAGGYINPLTTWLDSQNTSYLAWAWNADFNCSSGPGLVTDYVPGDPTAYGAAYKAHLASLGL
jgi:hypothetical protein